MFEIIVKLAVLLSVGFMSDTPQCSSVGVFANEWEDGSAQAIIFYNDDTNVHYYTFTIDAETQSLTFESPTHWPTYYDGSYVNVNDWQVQMTRDNECASPDI